MKLNSEILNKDHLRIIITDSGLGGLSVHANLDKLLRQKGINKKVELIFYNSLADHNYGYNSIPEASEKIRVFNSALNGMLKFNPDLILIACNTLSVIYNKTEFAKITSVPVLGIVELGIESIIENLDKKSDTNIIIFGTGTTIASNQHKTLLVKAGIDESLITNHACQNLESEIQKDPKSDKVRSMIIDFADEVYDKLSDKSLDCLSVLACTHYGYSMEIFQEVLNKRFNKNVKIINPNEKMATVAYNNITGDKSENNQITNRIVSRVDISDEEINSLGHLIKEDSSSVFEVLQKYELDEELFKI